MSKRFKLQLPTASQISIVLLLMILGSCQGIGSSTKESKASNPTIITKNFATPTNSHLDRAITQTLRY